MLLQKKLCLELPWRGFQYSSSESFKCSNICWISGDRRHRFQYSSSESFKCSRVRAVRPAAIRWFQYSSSESFKCSYKNSETFRAIVDSFSTLHLSRSNAPSAAIISDLTGSSCFSTLHLSRSNAPSSDPVRVCNSRRTFQYSSSESFKCSSTLRQYHNDSHDAVSVLFI